jgi:holo-[acyl-carrier protein] synthase
MILGIGVDMVEVADLARRLERSTIANAFSEAERAYAEARPERRDAVLATRWAAKEAFAKALGTGIRAQWPLNQIEVVRQEGGAPTIQLGPAVAGLVAPEATVHLSLSHTPAYAIAVVVIERD